MLKEKNILIGMTGGIACYKVCEIISHLVREGANVDVIMTKNATEFVTPLTFQTLSQRPVITDTFLQDNPAEVMHIAAKSRRRGKYFMFSFCLKTKWPTRK